MWNESSSCRASVTTKEVPMHYVMFSEEELYPTIELVTPLDNTMWVMGKRFAKPLPVIEFAFEPENGFRWADYIDPMASIPLFSAAMQSTLSRAGVDNVDYYPAGVTNSRTGERREYRAANIIGLVQGVDRGKSRFTPFEEGSFQIEFFEQLTLDERRIEGLRLLRLAEFSLLIIADDPLKVAVEGSNLVGVRFLRPEEWDGFTV